MMDSLRVIDYAGYVLSSRSLQTNFCPPKAMSNFVSANKANTPTQNDCTNRNSCATVNVTRGELILEGQIYKKFLRKLP